MNKDQFRLLPSVEELLRSTAGQDLIARYSRPLTLEAIRWKLSRARGAIRFGEPAPSFEELLASIEAFLAGMMKPNLRTVINATGVILHTNLGRAPLSEAALQAVREVAAGYSNLEYDLDEGERGSRHFHPARLLCELTGTESALVTNNNAAAVLLALSALAMGREVVISRGQLVEIGGGFRVPDVMRQSGCRLVEVGTTNRTRIGDYEAAITDQTALLLDVHPSNFLITGFTESVELKELVSLAHARGLLVVSDLGSGCLIDSTRYGLAHEPTPQEAIEAGVDLVCFSGDKLLGGPQAGIMLGRRQVIEQIATHPLMRALRVDKMTLGALEATLRHYKREEADDKIPIWRMIAARPEQLARRAGTWVTRLQAQGVAARTQRGQSTIGGGSLPGETLPTTLLAIDCASFSLPVDDMLFELRAWRNPIIARVAHDTLLLDPRTVLEEQDEAVIEGLSEIYHRQPDPED